MDVTGVFVVLVFYAFIIVCGLWVAKRKNVLHPRTAEDFMLAGKSLGLAVGICTLVATEVGGAFINGTAEEVYRNGVLWCLAPIGYSISMSVNGLLFAGKLREKQYLTVVDPLYKSYGSFGNVVYLPSCVGDVCWTAAVLSSLGSTLQVMLQVDRSATICVSAFIAVCYTLVGGMHSVAYTDVVQLAFIFLGLWLAIPFVLLSPDGLESIASSTRLDWTGEVAWTKLATYMDTFILVVCGGIPWQPYYQRALSVRTDRQVKVLSLCATTLCLLCMVPSVVFGVVAKRIDWTNSNFTSVVNDPSIVLPAVISLETPRWITLLCLASISAAVMSSVDSALLAGASYLSHNLYEQTFCPWRSEASLTSPERTWKSICVLRISIVLLGVISVLMSLATSTVYGLWLLAGDLGYICVFPQFLAAVHMEGHVNVVGSVAAAVTGVTLRVMVGEEIFGWRPIWDLPRYDDGNQVLPVKTIIMLTSLVALVGVSKLFKVGVIRCEGVLTSLSVIYRL